MDFLDDLPAAGDAGSESLSESEPAGAEPAGAGPVFADQDGNPASATEAEPERRPCHNCESALLGDFCHVCGQKDQDLDIRFSQLVADWFGGVFGFDARIWATLRILFIEPGQLTMEFLEGRRARHISPLRLYLVASLLMLLTFSWSGSTIINETGQSNSGSGLVLNIDSSDEAGEAEEEAGQFEIEAFGAAAGGASDSDEASAEPKGAEVDEAAKSSSGSDGDEEVHEDSGGGDSVPKILRNVGETLDKVGDGDSSDHKAFERTFRDYLPQALFALVPVFALQLWILFRKRFKRYLYHLIFSLHAHAVVFLVIAFSNPIDALFNFDYVGKIGTLAFFVHLFMALRRVYGDSWLAVSLKMFVLFITHGLMLSMALLGAVLLAAWRLQGG